MADNPAEAFPSLRRAKMLLRERHGVDLERSFRDWLGQLMPSRSDEEIDALIREGVEHALREASPLAPSLAALSDGERRALTVLAGGWGREEAAVRLGRSTETLMTQTKVARRKLGARTTAHAVLLGLYLGMLDPAEVLAEVFAEAGEPCLLRR